MPSKLSNMLLPQMVTIYKAISAVEGASKKDIAETVAALESEGFSSDEPVEGLFKSFDLALSTKLNGKQRTIAQIAQIKGEGIACMGHYYDHLGSDLLCCLFTARKDHGEHKISGEPNII